MLGPSSIKAIKYMFKTGNRLMMIPFDWDDFTNTPVFTKSKIRVGVFVTVTVYLMLQAIYQFRVLLEEAGDPNVPFEAYLNLCAHFASRLSAIIFQTWSVFARKGYSRIYSQMIRLNGHMKMELTEGSRVRKDRSSKTIWGLFIAAMLQPVVVAMTYLAEFRTRKYWQSQWIPRGLYPFTVPFFAIDEYYVSVYSNLGCCLVAFPPLLSLSLQPEWLDILREDMENEEKFGKLYRILQVFNKSLNEVYTRAFGFAMFDIFALLVIVNSATVRLATKLPFPENLLFPIGSILLVFLIFSLFRPAAILVERSEALICEYKNSIRISRRVMGRSLRCLTMEICGSFPVRNSTILTYLSETVNYTINVLLTA